MLICIAMSPIYIIKLIGESSKKKEVETVPSRQARACETDQIDYVTFWGALYLWYNACLF